MSALPPALRQARMLERLQHDGGVSVNELGRDYDRDLHTLVQQGFVERIHGGARLIGASTTSTSDRIPTAWAQRLQEAESAKRDIAKHAVKQVRSEQTIFLDASTTALALARELVLNPPGELTVVTNSPAIAYQFQCGSVHVVVTPGELEQHTRALSGRWTVEFLGQLHFATAFVSAAGLTLDQGLTTSRRSLADLVNAARARAERSVALIDSTKFGRASLLSVARAQDMDAVVTDNALADDVADLYRSAGVSLQIADDLARSEPPFEAR